MVSARVALLITSMIATLIPCFFYGVVILTYPLTLALCFVGSFLVFLFRAEIQANFNPGLERMDEPDYWFSTVYDIWLYVRDREEWAAYVSLWSGVFGFLLGSMFGVVLSTVWNISYTISLISWLVGMFLMGALAVFIATSEYWSKPQQVSDQEAIITNLE
jgi:hypothetical protein